MKTQQLNAEYLDISPEVAQALAEKKPVVALESTIISHGMPYPDNVKMALEVEQRIRDNGAIPATIAVINGRMKAGLSHDEIEMLGKEGHKVMKVSRRDLPFVIAQGIPYHSRSILIGERDVHTRRSKPTPKENRGNL